MNGNQWDFENQSRLLIPFLVPFCPVLFCPVLSCPVLFISNGNLTHAFNIGVTMQYVDVVPAHKSFVSAASLQTFQKYFYRPSYFSLF
jgi:hypothetical protein